MLGISYGELFVILAASAALLGPKDLPKVARTAGRLAGRAIGYVQLARGQFESIVQQSQASKVHKELQEAMMQIEAIRHEIRSVSLVNPGPLVRSLDHIHPTNDTGNKDPPNSESQQSIQSGPKMEMFKDSSSNAFSDLQSQAVAFAKLAESSRSKTQSLDDNAVLEELKVENGSITVLPVSAVSAGLLPQRTGQVKGSDLVLEAILEAEVATNAKHFFSQPESMIPKE